MEDNTANQLNTVRLHIQYTPCCFPDSGKSFRQQIIQGCPLGKPQPEFLGLGAQTGITEPGYFRFQCVDLIHIALADLQFFLIGVPKDQFHQVFQQVYHSSVL